MSDRISRRKLLGVAGTGTLIGVAGCTGDNGESSDSADSNGNGSESDDNTVVIGSMNPLSGEASVYGNPQTRGLQLGVSDLGEFEVDGETYQFEINENDDQCNNDQGINIARRLIEQEGINYLQGSLCSNVALATSDLVGDSNVIQFVNSAWDDAITYCHDWLFRNAYTGYQSIPSIEAFVDQEGYETIFLFGDEEHPNIVNMHPLLEDRFANDMGLDVEMMWYQRGQQDYSSEIGRIRQFDPDFVIHGGYTPDTYQFVQQSRDLDMNAPVLDQSQPAPGPVEEVVNDPSILEDVYAVMAPTSMNLAQDGYEPGEEYVSKINERFDNPETWHLGVANYDYVFLLKTAMQKAGTVDDPEAVRQELFNLTIEEAFEDSPLGGPGQPYVPPEGDRIFDDRGQAFFSTYFMGWDGFEQVVEDRVEPATVGEYPPNVEESC